MALLICMIILGMNSWASTDSQAQRFKKYLKFRNFLYCNFEQKSARNYFAKKFHNTWLTNHKT